MLVDIHCHLDHSRFSKDLDKVIERCRKSECVAVTSGVNTGTNKLALELGKKYKDVVKVSLGLYPIDALKKEIDSGDFPRTIEVVDIDKELEFIKRNKDKIIAVGEAGLDFHWDINHKEEQKENFLKVIELVEKIKKPLIVHSRKAEREAIEMLESSNVKNILMHCFSGRMNLVKRCISNGYNFSIPPIVVRVPQFKLLVKEVPITQLFSETDSPYLSPIKGKRNEPINVKFVIDEVSKIKNMDKIEVEKNVFMNFQKIFLKNSK